MNGLKVIQKNNQRVLTTAQLAEVYGTETKIVNRNFQRNTDRYVQGKHYFALSGEDLRHFKGSRQIDDNLKFASILYLWTEKGAWLHAKSLNTDEAWDAYEKLVDDYYRVKELIHPEESYMIEDPIERAKVWIKEQEARKELEQQAIADKPKVLFASALEVSESTILIGELSKLLKQNNIEIGQNRLFGWLREKGYLIKKKGELFNLPTQKSMDLGIFEIKKRVINNPDGSSRTTRTPKVTGKGQIYFVNKFLNGKGA